jgi:uncharacterized protein YcfJ
MCTVPRVIGTLGSLCAVTACAVQQPRGPTVMALPKQGTSLAVFQQQDQECRNYGAATIGYVQPGQAGTHAAVGSAALGTLAGAALGSAIGAAAGNAGAGAAIGAATGLVGGTAVGANNAAASEYDLQTRYDIAYTQCMYSLGNTVQSLPGGYGSYGYAAYGYPWYGYPWYGWGWPFFAGGTFVFVQGHNFDHHFHEGFHEGFSRPFPEAFNGGFHGGGGFHR